MIFPQTTFRDFKEESTLKMRKLSVVDPGLAVHISNSHGPGSDQGPDLNHKKNVSCYRTGGVELLSGQTQAGEFKANSIEA